MKHDKPEAISLICDGMEKRGLYTPPAPLTLDEYSELTTHACTLATNGQTDRAQFIRETCDL